VSQVFNTGKIQSLEGLQKQRATGLAPKGLDDKGEFRQTLRQIDQGAKGQLALRGENSPSESIRFSNHAIERMQSRGIVFSPECLGKIESAVERAAGKGAKETLILTDDSAMIVSVKNNTVVTVMDRNSLKDNVFTNIDSTVVI
jgi:flagellar operon protein